MEWYLTVTTIVTNLNMSKLGVLPIKIKLNSYKVHLTQFRAFKLRKRLFLVSYRKVNMSCDHK